MDFSNNELEKIGKVTALNGSTVYRSSHGIICGRLKYLYLDVLCKSGTSLDANTPLASVEFGATTTVLIANCIYRNSTSGAAKSANVSINTDGGIYPTTTDAGYNEIRVNVVYI